MTVTKLSRADLHRFTLIKIRNYQVDLRNPRQIVCFPLTVNAESGRSLRYRAHPVKLMGKYKKDLVVSRKDALAKEALRKRYHPAKVTLLFIGEAPPASGRFFYEANSGLYRAIRSTFVKAIPSLAGGDFLKFFQNLGCYLVDLCNRPVDHLGAAERRRVCLDGEVRLARMFRHLNPMIVVTVVRSIVPNVECAQKQARWQGTHLKLPYPGRWQHHRIEFQKALVPILRKELVNHGTIFFAKAQLHHLDSRAPNLVLN